MQETHTSKAATADTIATYPKGTEVEPQVVLDLEDSSIAKLKAPSIPQKACRPSSKLKVIFDNPIILASFVRNFKRHDYRMLSELAASIPGVKSWPQWNPLTQPWPQDQLPFHIRDLPVQCQNIRGSPRRLVPIAPSQSEVTICEWQYPRNATPDKVCPLTERVQGWRPAPGPNHKKMLEKAPIEFLECVGHRLQLAALTEFDASACLKEMGSTMSLSPPCLERMETVLRLLETDGSSSTLTLTDLHRAHDSGYIICSRCARENHMRSNLCLWHHERMIPLCRDCSNPPSSENLNQKPTGQRPTLTENIRYFAQGREHFECDCYNHFSPNRGYHLCRHCALWLNTFVNVQFEMDSESMFPEEDQRHVLEAGNPDEDFLGRNYCPCGKNWQELTASWDDIS